MPGGPGLRVVTLPLVSQTGWDAERRLASGLVDGYGGNMVKRRTPARGDRGCFVGGVNGDRNLNARPDLRELARCGFG